MDLKNVALNSSSIRTIEGKTVLSVSEGLDSQVTIVFVLLLVVRVIETLLRLFLGTLIHTSGDIDSPFGCFWPIEQRKLLQLVNAAKVLSEVVHFFDSIQVELPSAHSDESHQANQEAKKDVGSNEVFLLLGYRSAFELGNGAQFDVKRMLEISFMEGLDI